MSESELTRSISRRLAEAEARIAELEAEADAERQRAREGEWVRAGFWAVALNAIIWPFGE